jgi:hypothetical protein
LSNTRIFPNGADEWFDRTEDQDGKNPGVNANYANLVHNDLNDNSGRVRCRELLTKNLRNFGRQQHYTEEEADAKMSRRFMSINLAKPIETVEQFPFVLCAWPRQTRRVRWRSCSRKRPNSRAAPALAELDRLAPCSNGFLPPSTGFGSVFIFIAGHRFGCGGLQLGRPLRNSTVSLSLAWAIWRAPALRGRGRARLRRRSPHRRAHNWRCAAL